MGLKPGSENPASGSVKLPEPSAPPKSVKRPPKPPKPPKPKSGKLKAPKQPPKDLTPEERAAKKAEAKLIRQRARHKVAEAERRKKAAEDYIAYLKQLDREERQRERSAAVEKFIAAIEACSFSDLLDAWKKHAPKTSTPNRAASELSERMVLAVEAEWKRRRRFCKPEDYFDWPTTEIGPDRGGSVAPSEWVLEGLLHCMGYHVGRGSTLTPDGRCRLLTRIYQGHLPPVNGPAYMSEWGRPESALRLEKMAQSLASFARQAKRRSSANLTEAIHSWEHDLGYLYDHYYAPKFWFRWPSQ